MMGSAERICAKYQIVIVGGGCAGLTVAASLKRRDKTLSLAIIEPSEKHWYQPGFTLVGAGVFTRKQTERDEKGLVPSGTIWIKAEVVGFAPEENLVRLSDGRIIAYDWLVVCPGLKLSWEKVPGLQETLGKNDVCSNYLPDYAEYTWDCIQRFRGGVALFTQPPMPIKCAGAPQKIMYLAADFLRKKHLLNKAHIEFCLAGDVLFGVPFFVPPLQTAVDSYGIHLRYKHNLIGVDGNAKKAIFTTIDADGKTREVIKSFDMMHVTPPQSAPDFVSSSPLANSAGWVDVDQESLRHTRYANVFSLGDACSTPNAKTAAAVRLQAPVVVKNLQAAIAGQMLATTYDGYGSCPLTVAYGKVVLAEFGYGGKVTPSFPLDPRVPRRSMWHLKTKLLPWLYWKHMFGGGEFDIPHKERQFAKTA